MPIPPRDSHFLEALPKADTDSSSPPTTFSSVSSKLSSSATSMSKKITVSSTFNSSRKESRTISPSHGKNRLKRKLHDMIFGAPPPLSSEGWVLRPDLLFEMQKAVGKSGEDVRRDLAREMEGRDADGNGGRRGKRPKSAAEVEARRWIFLFSRV